MSKPELVAIYRLEFYKKQKNWKFAADREAKKKSAKVKKRLLDKTYTVTDKDTVSPHNEAFLETGPTDHSSDLGVAVFEITHTNKDAEPATKESQPLTRDPQKTLDPNINHDVNSNYVDINSNYSNKQNIEEHTIPEIRPRSKMQAFFAAIRNCSEYTEEPNKPNTCYSQEPNGPNTCYSQEQNDPNTCYSQEPNDPNTCYSQEPNDPNTCYSQEPNGPNTCYSQETNGPNIWCYRNNDWPECDSVFYTNPVVTDEGYAWDQKCGGGNPGQSVVIWPPQYAPEADLVTGPCPDEKQNMLLQDLWIQLQVAADTNKPDGDHLEEYPYQQPDHSPAAYKEMNPKNPQNMENYPLYHQKLGNSRPYQNNPENPQKFGNNPMYQRCLGIDLPYPNDPKEQHLENGPMYQQQLATSPPYPKNPKNSQNLGNNRPYPRYPNTNNPENPKNFGNNPAYPNDPKVPRRLEDNSPYPPQLLDNPRYPKNPKNYGNNPAYPNDPKVPQLLGDNSPYPPQQLDNPRYPMNPENPQSLVNNQLYPKKSGNTPPYQQSPNNPGTPQNNTIYQQNFRIDPPYPKNPPYPNDPKAPQSRPSSAKPQPDENFLKNLLQNRLDLSLKMGRGSEFGGVSYDQGTKSETAMSVEWVEDFCGAHGCDSWSSLDSAEFMLGAHCAPHSSEVDLARVDREAPPPNLRRDVTGPGRGRGRLTAREREAGLAMLWARRGRM